MVVSFISLRVGCIPVCCRVLSFRPVFRTFCPKNLLDARHWSAPVQIKALPRCDRPSKDGPDCDSYPQPGATAQLNSDKGGEKGTEHCRNSNLYRRASHIYFSPKRGGRGRPPHTPRPLTSSRHRWLAAALRAPAASGTYLQFHVPSRTAPSCSSPRASRTAPGPAPPSW